MHILLWIASNDILNYLRQFIRATTSNEAINIHTRKDKEKIFYNCRIVKDYQTDV